MGIKGIYSEIGPGERVALSKLAIETLEQKRRPLRIAIDVSIWQFQTQAGRGGSNPAIRTFYYRLLRLLSLSVQPLFVFDGPHKPPFKRNKKTGQDGAVIPNLLTKQLLNLFGFPFHIAPGEAEAECALLQIEGIVDAVLSEDVDTLMFGCGTTLRNWSSEGSRGNKAPTHVSVYDARKTKEGKAGLDRKGMVLIALMSGGDYIPAGIPGCGIKVACEAARGGYGKRLCELSRTDKAGLVAWRSDLAHELETNESKHFRVKHKSLKIPHGFPNQEVLGYYTHPVVSSASKLQRLKSTILWDGQVDIAGLRVFVAEAFDWSHREGARKFIRGLAPALLIQKLRLRGDRRDSGLEDIVLTSCNELELVRTICGQRTHFSSDGLPEVRVIYYPLNIVGVDLDAEEDGEDDFGRDGLAPDESDDYAEEGISNEPPVATHLANPNKRAASTYDPSQPDKLWIPQTMAKLGIPLKLEDYEESLRDPRKFIKQKAAIKRATTKGAMPKGAMDRYITTLKPSFGSNSVSSSPSQKVAVATQPISPPVFLAPTLERLTRSQDLSASTMRGPVLRKESHVNPGGSPKVSMRTTTTSRQRKPKIASESRNLNPWTRSRTDSAVNTALKVTKPLSQPPKHSRPQSFEPNKSQPIELVSSPAITRLSPLPGTKPITPTNDPRSPFQPSLEVIELESTEPELPALPSSVRKTRGRDTLRENCDTRLSDMERIRESIDPELERTETGLSPQASMTSFSTSNERSGLLVAPPSALNDPIILTSSPPASPILQRHQTSQGSTSPRVEIPTNKQPSRGERKQIFMLRESIGAWEQFPEDELGAKQMLERKKRKERRVVRESQVEILDLREGE